MKNLFKKGIEPALDVISSTIGRDAKPVNKLNPPVFEVDTIDFRQPLGLFVQKTSFGFFKV